MNARRAFDIVHSALASGGHPVALAGAFAMNAYGLGRMTADLDLVVPLAAQDAVIGGLQAAGFRTLHRSEGYSNHTHPDAELGRVDLIYVEPVTAEKFFGAARPVPFPGGGVEVLLPRAEHLAAMKVQAIKNDRSRRLRDLADIEFLLTLPGVDRSEVHGYFERAGLKDEWNELTKR